MELADPLINVRKGVSVMQNGAVCGTVFSSSLGIDW